MGQLHEAIAAYIAEARASRPADVLQAMARSTQELKDSGIEDRALKVGDSVPDFELPNQYGVRRRFSEYLAQAPVVLNIYRGGWCPYCNMEMKALHDSLPEITARGALLVGMSPEMPDRAATSAENNELGIDILSDTGNEVAERMGLVFELPQALRPVYEKFGIDIPAYNGDDSFRLPVPASYIIRRDGIIAFAFVNADYTQRLEPSVIVNKLDELFR